MYIIQQSNEENYQSIKAPPLWVRAQATLEVSVFRPSLRIFLFWLIFKYFLRNEPVRNLFVSSGSFESRQSGWHDLWTRAMCTGATHFYIDIRCHVNSTGPTTPFDTQNESHYFE
jgi:hypothetical protein